MADSIVVEFPDGRNVLIGDGDFGGLAEVGVGESVRKVAIASLESAFASLTDFLQIVEKSIGQAAKKPSKVELEFGVSITSDCNLWIVSGEGKAEFKVKVSWDTEKR
jgi:hypothetical protein